MSRSMALDILQPSYTDLIHIRMIIRIEPAYANDVGRKIEEWVNNGWVPYAYTTASFQSTVVNRYLLFLKEE